MSDTKKADLLLTKLKTKNPTDYTHSLRVQTIVSHLLDAYDMTGPDADSILLAALLHDIGNLSISNDILNKQKRLSYEEFETVQEHVTHFENLLNDFEQADKLIPLIRQHHENVNGFGYPDGLKGDDILFGARLIHVAEAYDAMLFDRQKGIKRLDPDTAIKELQKFSGRMYDAKIIENFSLIYKDIIFEEK